MRSLARWTDVIRGVAIGDAWGAPNELYTYVEIPEIAKRDSTYLPKNLEVTDDTQMTLFLARALNGCRGEAEIKQAIVREFLNYLHDVDFASR
nr:ADP-ribosylglycohydrolase family protein [Actinomycetes bacterium]